MAIFGFGKKKNKTKNVEPINKVEPIKKVDIEDFWEAPLNSSNKIANKPKLADEIDPQLLETGLEKLEEEIKLKEIKKAVSYDVEIIKQSDMEDAVSDFDKYARERQKALNEMNLVSLDDVDEELLKTVLVKLEEELDSRDNKSPVQNQIDEIPISDLEIASLEFKNTQVIEFNEEEINIDIDSVDASDIKEKVNELREEYSYLTDDEKKIQYNFDSLENK